MKKAKTKHANLKILGNSWMSALHKLNMFTSTARDFKCACVCVCVASRHQEAVPFGGCGQQAHSLSVQ